jgi:sulfatase maturation enzyme AslB (radical SAM superfamily)
MSADTLPQIFVIETTLACNLKCPECFTGGGKIQRGGKFMDLNAFRTIMEKIRPFVKYLYLYSWGEPLLNRDILAMIRCASEITSTNISTNGLLLTEETAVELITSGVTDIIVSIDGVAQEVYEKYRVGGDVSKAMNSLALLKRLNAGHGNKVNIIPQFIVFKHNQHEIRAFYDICRDLELVPSFKAPYIRTRKSRISYSDYPQFVRPHFPEISELRDAMTECLDPRHVFTILMDGSAVICCSDVEGRTCFGNIFTKDVPEIWCSEAYVNFRRAILTGNAPDFCINHCMSYFLEKPEDIATGFFGTGEAAYTDQGEILYLTGDTQGAADMFGKAIALAQRADAAHNNLAVISWQKGDTAAAIGHFAAALAINSDYRPAVVNYVHALYALARKDDALKVSREYLQNHPDDTELTAFLEGFSH